MAGAWVADPGLGPHDPFLLSRTGLPTPAHLLFHPGQDPMPSWQRGVRTTCIYLGGLSVLSHSTAGAQGQAGGPPVGGEQWVGGQQAWEGMGFENMLVSPRNTLWRPPPQAWRNQPELQSWGRVCDPGSPPFLLGEQTGPGPHYLLSGAHSLGTGCGGTAWSPRSPGGGVLDGTFPPRRLLPNSGGKRLKPRNLPHET